MRDIRSHSDIAFAENYTPVTGVPVNPTDNRFKAQRNALSERANQDIRGLIYGIDIFKLMTYFVLYAQELHCKRNTDELWRSIEELCAKTEEYCYSVKYNGTRPELNCVDTLERSGLKDLYYRCLSERQRAK